MIRSLIVALTALAVLPTQAAVAPPAPHGATPTKQQVDWLRLEWYGFVHFGINTFTNREWGMGDEDPKLFNPSDFDASSIVGTFKEAGMTGMIYTAKHHDGFCLWPTKTTEHNITKSPWKKGKGDVAREFAEACAMHGLKFGTYLSPWDRNNAEYGRPGYLDVYYGQIKELLTQYGPIFEIWFDGANGGSGYYGGARERRNIGKAEVYYNFPEVVRMIRAIQPDCIIWGAENNGDVMWGGSEKGFVRYPCWNVINKDKPNEKWISLEADTPINRGWFWQPNSADRVKSPEKLMNIYLESVGRGANLILNLAPDRTGHLDPADVRSLLLFGEMRRRLLAKDFALKAKVKASEVRGNDAEFSGSRVTDGDIESYWCPEDGTLTGELEITLPKPVTFDVVRLREQIRLGQRVTGFRIDVLVNKEWQTVDNEGQTIGNQVLRKLEKPVTTSKVRIAITGSRACPCISEVSLLLMPKLKDVERTYKVKAVAGDKVSLSTLKRTNWRSTTPGGQAALDGKPATHWESSDASARTLEVDMGKAEVFRGFCYLPRQDEKLANMTDRYRFEVSNDGKEWTQVSEGEFSNIQANPIELRIFFEKDVKARYFRLVGEHAIEGEGASAAEVQLFRVVEKKSR